MSLIKIRDISKFCRIHQDLHQTDAMERYIMIAALMACSAAALPGTQASVDTTTNALKKITDVKGCKVDNEA